MKYFVYAKIGKYLYRQRVLPENLSVGHGSFI